MVSALSLMLSTALAGGGYDTNHPDVRWNTLNTDHFAFHWPESTRDQSDPHYFTTSFTANRLADIAEVSYSQICDQLQFYPTETIHVVIYDQDVGWEGNGFAIAELDWTGFAADWAPLYRQRGRMEFLSDVFVHEFAHIVSLKAYLHWSEASTGFELGGLAEDEEWLRRWGYAGKQNVNFDLGGSVLVSAHAPFWWAEGGAEYWSHNAGYNFWGNSREALLRTTFLEDRVLDQSEWTTRIDKKGFDGERGYNQGYAFGLFLQEYLEQDAMSQMAIKSAERWHLNWDSVVAEATGQEMDDLFAAWKEYQNKKYEQQLKPVIEKGVVQGKELSLTEPLWESTVPEKQTQWNALSKKKKEALQDGLTAYQEFPRYSPNGEYFTWFEQGLNVMAMRSDQWGAISGQYFDGDDRKVMKSEENSIYNSAEIRPYPVNWSPDSSKLVAVGPEDWAGPLVMEQGLQFNADGYNWNQLLIGELTHSEEGVDVLWSPVPNTLRATEAVWHPGSEWLAFSRYGDGTHNVWTIRPDGTEAKQHSQFKDGTQIQSMHWTPDGQFLIMALYRNHLQELWMLDVGTGSWSQITDNTLDETDPYITQDGKLWFSSDLNDIFNVFSMDLSTCEVWQHSNVVGSSYGVDVSPRGDIFYTDFTGHGYRIKAIAAEDALQEKVDYPGACTDKRNVFAKISTSPPEPTIVDQSIQYKAFEQQMPFNIWPVARSTDKNVEIGTSFFFGDFVEKHTLEGQVTFGKDNYFYLNYWNSQFWPNLSLGISRYSYKGNYGYGDDIDGNPETDDLRVVDVKFEQLGEDIWFTASYVPSYSLWLSLVADASRFSFRETGDGPNWAPYQRGAGIGAYLEWSPRGYYMGDDWINPRGGRRVYVDYSLRKSEIIDTDSAGSVYDDGELLENYHYHRLMVNWTEFVPVPFTEHHTLQFDVDFGYINRNVMGWDEFMAGGRHPYNWGNGTIGNNIQFSGFEGYSLSGETMLIANAAYRFPVLQDLNWKIGPTYTDSVYLQFFGTVGNLWSYRVEGERHIEGYSVVPSQGGSIRREVPFKDYASKNSPQGEEHYVLSDVGTEIRIRSFIWNDWDWDGFLRVSYGLQNTAGYGDVNADMLQSSVSRNAASELSAEIEGSTFHIYAGLGTGW
jgi:hypothetical protein